MKSEEIRRRFLEFFRKRGHTVIPSASLIPENDPSVLFTTAGMHPLVPYLLGEEHPEGKKLANVQKCVRTQDIEEVGDNTHDTFFEMLGNWSLGDYFKKEAIEWSYEFLTNKEEGLGLNPKKLYITCFEGDENAPRDDESAAVWMSLGIPKSRIYFLNAKNNWWSPGPNGPCGPDTEMFYDLTEEGMGDLSKDEFLKATDEQKIVEVWNDVFMEYEKADGKVIGQLQNKNVDTGAGLERLSMVMQSKDNIFDTDLFAPIMAKINENTKSTDERAKRIIADHIRTAVFMIADGITPSNTDRGYVLRRLLRRAIFHSNKLGTDISIYKLVNVITELYKNTYTDAYDKTKKISEAINNEELKFRETISSGEKELVKMIARNLHEKTKKGERIEGLEINGKNLFYMYSTFGYPFELSIEAMNEIREHYHLKANLRNLNVKEYFKHERGVSDISDKELKIFKKEFNEEMKKHQELSRAGAEQKFKGGLASHDEQSVKYHTATHLLHKALREVLGNHVFQKGSNITPERLRFDFSFERKMTDEEKKKTENMVNERIKESIPVIYEDLPLEEAKKRGAIGLFEEKYGTKVRVYKIGDFSLEFCGGPHVTNTSELGKFRILKEEAVSQGVRRIKAVLD